MYAVVRAGGKQYKVATGDVIEIERLKDSPETVELTPVLIVDDDGGARAGRDELASATVTARVLEESKGPKVHVYKFRSKSGYRRHTGHRQIYSLVQISDITLGGSSRKKSRSKQGARDGA
jgi:large subunit ribosomal protein L21